MGKVWRVGESLEREKKVRRVGERYEGAGEGLERKGRSDRKDKVQMVGKV